MENGAFNVDIAFRIKKLREKFTTDQDFFSEAIALCKKVLVAQRHEITSKGFSNKVEEIHFFKEIKQHALHHFIYYTELKIFEIKFPIGSMAKKEKYINKNLVKIQKFFEYNLDFINYWDSKHDYLDEQYFLRKNLDFSRIIHSEFYNIDPEFNTSHDLILAKVLAYKKLAKYLEKRLLKLHHPEIQKMPKSQLKWTSSKAALTELTYALYHGGAINNGNTDIREIATALEQTFNFPIGDIYRTYSEIRSRKNRRSKFLDELSSSLISGMNTLDE